MGTLFFELALTLYFAGFILGIVGIIRKKNELDEAVFLLGLGGFGLHTVYLFVRYINSGQAPVFSMHEASSFFAWSVMFTSLVIRFYHKTKILNFSLILVFALMFISAFFSRIIPSLKPEQKSFWIDIHALTAVFGISLFSLAFVLSILYLLQEKAIKNKKLRAFLNMIPSLEVLDKINYQLIFWGFPIYSLALIVGLIKYYSMHGFLFDPKEVMTLMTWVVYLVIFYLRVKEDWRKKRAAYLTIFGFLLVIIGFFGINLLTESFHRLI
ncbi:MULTISPECIES: cytochrome C assembly family protein [Thermodesulfovibrio]|jgi:ABC-type uncharacterized transport system permease subunit|uniref:cytochrome C assembly family protein n=1 Tax=Thermodesulfovibrio TaxID=28261 RepID=UPI00260BEAA3|nr:cytochrome c biogenesis protein CcsA [Thermodesulfovibrio sp.]